MRNKKFIIVLIISIVALILIWTPIQFDNGDTRIILGGYYWLMPSALKMFFLSISVLFSVIFSILPIIYYFLLKKISTEELKSEAEIPNEEVVRRNENNEKDVLEDF